MLKTKRIILVWALVLCLFLSVVVVKSESNSSDDEHHENEEDENVFDKYKFIVDPEDSICGRDFVYETRQGRHRGLLLLALVTIPVEHFKSRLAIRHTWANYNLFSGMRIVFITGKSTSDDVNKRVLVESDIYGDIVQADFEDTRKNMTTKTMLGIRWANEYCSNAKFVLKVDEDVVVNTHFLLNYLRSFVARHDKTSTHNSMICRKVTGLAVERNASSKFFVSKEEYAEDEYPAHCDGHAYLMTADLLPLVYNESRSMEPFVFDNIYIGMLCKRLETTIINISNSYIKHFHYGPALFLHRKIDSFYFVYANGLDQFYGVWNQVYHDFMAFLSHVFVFF